MAYLNRIQLDNFGFKFIGKNVKVSDKASIYNPELISIGDNSRIDDFCVISGKVTLGRNVHITPFCLVAGGDVGIKLDDFSALAYRVTVFTQSDDYSGKFMTNPTVPSEYTKCTARNITIGKHTIIGANSVVLPGAKIGVGVSIGAGSHVQGNIKKWRIYSGNPLEYLRDRKQNLLVLESEYINKDK